MATKFGEAYGKVAAADMIVVLNRSWETYKNEWEGWQTETAGPTLDELLKNQSEEMSALKAPKTIEMISRANSWIEDRDKDPEFKKLAAVPAVKAIYDKVVSDRQKGWDKLAGYAEVVLKDAEKAAWNDDVRRRVDTFGEDNLRLALEGYPKLKELQDRAKKMVTNYDTVVKGGAEAAEKLVAALTKKAEADWPALVGKIKTADGYSPANVANFKGQTIRIKGVYNRMGWDYVSKDGSFQFASSMDGKVYAAK